MARKSSKNSNPIADFIDRSAAWFRSSGSTVSLIAAAACVLVAVVLIGVALLLLLGVRLATVRRPGNAERA